MPFLGSGPGKGQCLVEWGEIPSVCLFIHLPIHPLFMWSICPLSKGSEGQLEGSGGLPEGSEILPEGSDGLTEGSEGLTDGFGTFQRDLRA